MHMQPFATKHFIVNHVLFGSACNLHVRALEKTRNIKCCFSDNEWLGTLIAYPYKPELEDYFIYLANPG